MAIARPLHLPAPCAVQPCMVPPAAETAKVSHDNDSSPPSPAPGPAQAPAGPLIMHGQYIKDLSFENPRAPQSLIEQTQPQLSLNVQVTNRQFDAKTFEVSLSIEANAKTAKDEPLFMLELVYAGTVTLGDVPQDAFGPLLFIETPRLLVPLRPRRRRQRHARGGLPAAQHRAGRFRGALPPAARGQRRQDAGRRSRWSGGARLRQSSKGTSQRIRGVVGVHKVDRLYLLLVQLELLRIVLRASTSEQVPVEKYIPFELRDGITPICSFGTCRVWPLHRI